MTKKELSQLRFISKEIEILKKQIEEAEKLTEMHTASDVVEGSNPVWPYQKRTFYIEGVALPDYERRVQRLRNKLKHRMDELIKEREKLEEYINGIQDSQIRIILTLRYVKGYSWRQIANQIGGGNTPDSVRKMHDRFLKGSVTFDKSNKEKTVSDNQLRVRRDN